MPSRRPAPVPSSAMPGATSPSTMSGMEKLRKCPKISLNVAKKRATASGRKVEQRTPAVMASRMRGSRPIFSSGFMARRCRLRKTGVRGMPVTDRLFCRRPRRGVLEGSIRVFEAVSAGTGVVRGYVLSSLRRETAVSRSGRDRPRFPARVRIVPVPSEEVRDSGPACVRPAAVCARALIS